MALLPQLIIAPTDKVVICGDSITAANPPWYRDLIAMGGRGTDIGNAPGRGGYYRHVDPPAGVTWVASGVPGNKASDIAADVANRITNANPQCLILQVGVNDITGGTSDGSFSTSFNSIVDQARVTIPTLKILSVGIFLDLENIPNGTEANIDAKNAIQLASMVRIGGAYAPVRTQIVAWEAINNPGMAASGFLTSDGIHPNTLGNYQISFWTSPYVTYSGR